MNKVTKRDVINMMLSDSAIAENATYKAFLEHEIELLDKKATNKKPTKTQAENVALKERIAAVLTAEGQTVTEILTALATDGLSNQKVSSMLKQMEQDGIAVKTIDKRRSLYSLAA